MRNAPLTWVETYVEGTLRQGNVLRKSHLSQNIYITRVFGPYLEDNQGGQGEEQNGYGGQK